MPNKEFIGDIQTIEVTRSDETDAGVLALLQEMIVAAGGELVRDDSTVLTYDGEDVTIDDLKKQIDSVLDVSSAILTGTSEDADVVFDYYTLAVIV